MNVVSFNLIKKYTHVYKNNPIKLVPGIFIKAVHNLMLAEIKYQN